MVSIGDSFTEGIGDPIPGSDDHRGWADRVAEVLGAQVDDFAYATREGLVPPLVERTDTASIQANGLQGPFAEIVFDIRLSALVQGVDNQIVDRPRLAA